MAAADVVEEAAALWESLTMNRGFIDGNERVGFAALHVFLRMNRRDLAATAEETLQFVIGALEQRRFEKPLLERWLRQRTRERGP